MAQDTQFLERVDQTQLAQIGETFGLGTQHVLTALENSKRGNTDWRHALRSFMRRQMEDAYSTSVPSRRLPDLVGIVPGRQRRAKRLQVMAAIDTSGSMTNDLLELIGGELKRLAKHADIQIVECDCEIQRIYPYKGEIHNVCGQGGTDLRPVFERALLRRLNPDAVVYFTDGRGPAPEKNTQTRIPVLWVLTPDGIRPAS